LDPFGPRVAPDPFNWKTHIWNLKISPRTKLLLWKVGQYALPVGLNLTHRHITESAKCPFCDDDESVLHLLFKCPFAQKIWSLAPFKSPLICTSILSVTEGIASSSKAICLPPSGLGGGRLSPWLFWTIWSSRNQLIFNKKQTLAEDAYLLAITRAKEWQSANQTQSLPTRIPDPLVIPRSHSIDPVCCTDAAWKTEGSAGFGWICKDSRNQTIFQGSSASSSPVVSPLVAEALATLLAIGVAIESGIKRISFASDSLTLVKAINRKFLAKELHRILHDIHSLSISFDACSFFFISRKHNSEADALAKDAPYPVLTPLSK